MKFQQTYGIYSMYPVDCSLQAVWPSHNSFTAQGKGSFSCAQIPSKPPAAWLKQHRPVQGTGSWHGWEGFGQILHDLP